MEVDAEVEEFGWIWGIKKVKEEGAGGHEEIHERVAQ